MSVPLGFLLSPIAALTKQWAHGQKDKTRAPLHCGVTLALTALHRLTNGQSGGLKVLATRTSTSRDEPLKHSVCEQADDHRHRETQKSAEQDVLGVHQLFVIS